MNTGADMIDVIPCPRISLISSFQLLPSRFTSSTSTYSLFSNARLQCGMVASGTRSSGSRGFGSSAPRTAQASAAHSSDA